jgi:hypothetical protein
MSATKTDDSLPLSKKGEVTDIYELLFEIRGVLGSVLQELKDLNQRQPSTET